MISEHNEGGIILWDRYFVFIYQVPQKYDRDRAFNSLRVLYWKQSDFTFDKCCENLNTSKNVEVIKMLHENFFDLGSFLNDLYYRPDTKTFNINNIFQFKKDLAHIGYRQDFYGEAESEHNYNMNNAYSN